jgi:hypothetical protein
MVHIVRKVLRRSLKGALALLFLCFTWAGMDQELNEYSVKAMFIYNFTKYVEWPATSDQRAIQIAVSGYTPVQKALIELSQHINAGQKKLQVLHLDPNSATQYHVIFVPHEEQERLEEIAKRFQGKGVLIVSEEAKNASKGAAINLLVSDNKIRFEVFLSNARNGGVKISSQLTNLAIRVTQ